jgi:hypothetical protein
VSWTHLHLMVNHLPVLGAPALLLMLAWALMRRSPALAGAALWGTVLLAPAAQRGRRSLEGPALAGHASVAHVRAHRPGSDERTHGVQRLDRRDDPAHRDPRGRRERSIAGCIARAERR